MNIVDRIKALNLPIGKYVVIGGVMEVHDIRKARDIDIVVNNDLYRELKKQGWKRKWFFWRVFSTKLIKKGDAEAFTTYKYKDYQPTTENLIRNAEMINGIPFLPLKDLMEFKKRLARKKDLADVKLIEKHLLDIKKNSPRDESP